MRIAVAVRARARTEWPVLSAAWRVARPIPLLAPMIKTVAIGVNTSFEFLLAGALVQFV